MSRIFAVIVQTTDAYQAYSQSHPEHQREQGAWFRQMAGQGKLVACGPFVPMDGTGLWLLRAESLEEARALAAESPRARAGVLSDETRIVEWNTAIGSERFA